MGSFLDSFVSINQVDMVPGNSTFSRVRLSSKFSESQIVSSSTFSILEL